MPMRHALNNELSEKQLVQLAQRGDKQAFARLYEAHNDGCMPSVCASRGIRLKPRTACKKPSAMLPAAFDISGRSSVVDMALSAHGERGADAVAGRAQQARFARYERNAGRFRRECHPQCVPVDDLQLTGA